MAATVQRLSMLAVRLRIEQIAREVSELEGVYLEKSALRKLSTPPLKFRIRRHLMIEEQLLYDTISEIIRHAGSEARATEEKGVGRNLIRKAMIATACHYLWLC